MINEQDVQERVNRRLSGLAASSQRRMRIRTAIHAEREEVQPVKRTISMTLAVAMISVVLLATVAIAEYFNLFGFFGRHDDRYAIIAPHASLTITEPALVTHPHLGKVTASIDSAYFDGLSLNLAYRIDHPRYAEAYTPSAEELAGMQPAQPYPVAVAENAPYADIYTAYNEALVEGTPFGYREYTVYPSDHTVTDDGMDIPPYRALESYDETGAYCEIREFETPLPAELRGRGELNVSVRLSQQETTVWFDGQNTYMKHERSEVGRMDAVIPLTRDAVQSLQGNGMIHGVACEAKAEVSQMAASVTVSCEAPLSTFLLSPPERLSQHDAWVEVIAIDENGYAYWPQEGFRLDDRTGFNLSLEGSGTLPQTLTVYFYTMWEGADKPELTTLEGIVMTVAR